MKDKVISNGLIPDCIKALRAAGVKTATIARLWGVSKGSVYRHMEPARIRKIEAKAFKEAWPLMMQVARRAIELEKRI